MLETDTSKILNAIRGRRIGVMCGGTVEPNWLSCGGARGATKGSIS